LVIVVLKLIALKIDDAPARCKGRIAKSTDGPPVPTPLSTNINKIRSSDGNRSHSIRLFSRGKVISGVPSINGNNQVSRSSNEYCCNEEENEL